MRFIQKNYQKQAMYVKHNIVARSRNHYKGDEATYPVCIVLLHVTVKSIKILKAALK
jgi:hypothetical protein